MNPLPTISHRLFAAALVNHAERAPVRKVQFVVETLENLSRNQHETKNPGRSVPTGTPHRLAAATVTSGIKI